MNQPAAARPLPRTTPAVTAVTLLTLLVHFLTNRGYGYFRDEFYYMACGRHLALGYVDHPPMIALVAAITHALFGDSLFALRFLPALAHAGLVLITGRMARELGGGRYAQALAALMVLIAPVFLGTDTILTLNAFDQLLWAWGSLILMMALNREAPRLWLNFGVIAGLDLMTKHSTAFFLVATFVALLLTPERRWLKTRWPWLAAMIAALIFLPNVFWQMRHDWPTLEFLRNAAAHKNYSGSPVEFISAQTLLVHPLNVPFCLAGLAYLLVSNTAARMRVMGWSYLILLVLFVVMKAKHYYLAPVYPVLLAAGAVALGRWKMSRNLSRMRLAIPAALAAGGVMTAPLVIPLLPPEPFIRYAHALGFSEPPSERHRPAKLPQTFADMFGWEEMARAVARVYHTLPDDEQKSCVIFTSNYGEAGALEFFRKKYGLPQVISGHNNYYLWMPDSLSAKVVITVGEDPEDVAESCRSVVEAARFNNDYNMPYESDLPILIGRDWKRPWSEIRPETKKYI